MISLIMASKAEKEEDYFCALLQLSQMAVEYVSSCASSGSECHSDEPTSDGPIAGKRSCDVVYVWGSNSSHQLAEGAQEKLTSPKPALAFSDVVEVGDYLTSRYGVYLTGLTY